MKKLTIYNVYVEMQDQAQCDRMKQLCIDNGLKWGKLSTSFEIDKELNYYKFHFSKNSDLFFIGDNYYNFKKVTEQEFIELLKNK